MITKLANIELALTLPGNNTIDPPPGLKGEFTNPATAGLASFLSPLLNIVFYIVIFLTFYYMIWGAFQYIMARGDKEALHKARARITWALVGLIVVLMAFFITQYASEIFKPLPGNLPFENNP
jgi:hypothetical protein